jgi:PRC-barrel domain protein
MSTARIWSRHDPAFAAELRGFDVEALDGRIGTVDEATDERRGGYVVVDSGPWIFRRKVMLPAGVIDRIDREARTVYVNRTKQEIKNAPEFGEAGYDDDAYRVALGRYYGSGGAGFRAPPPA